MHITYTMFVFVCVSAVQGKGVQTDYSIKMCKYLGIYIS